VEISKKISFFVVFKKFHRSCRRQKDSLGLAALQIIGDDLFWIFEKAGGLFRDLT
jgi:hypothetical protein